jgi:hypothetical protein
MYLSQAVRFCYERETDNDSEHPPGESIARLLRSELSEKGWHASELDNWRDCGWVFVCGGKDAELELVLAKMAIGSDWMLQISPRYCPGLLGWILGKKPSAQPADVYAIARDLQGIISGLDGYRHIQWCWDGVPNDNNSTNEPSGPSGLGDSS